MVTRLGSGKMPILFIVTFILVIYSFLRIKKTDNKLNILLWIFISMITYMGYNSLIIYGLSKLGIHSTLLLRSIINIVISIIMIIIARKNKQKYYFDKMDLGVIILLFYLSLVVFLFRFGFKLNLDFEVNDPAAHFAMAKAYMNSGIYDSSMSNIYYEISDRGMFFSSTNLGTFLEIIKPITKDIELYKGFIIFEMLSFFLSGVLLYFIVRKDKYKNKDYLLTIILLILYQLGYPLLNLLMGFHYWGLIILVISSIIITIKELTKNKMYKSAAVIAMLLIQTFSVFVAYYLYVPVVYGTLGLYLLYLWKFKKEISLRRCLFYIFIILIVPFVFGILYFDIVGEYFNNSSTSTSMHNDGSNYKNLLGNFIYFIPVIVYSVIDEIKKKKITLVTIMAILNIIYVIVLFILCMKGIMSNYYYNKIYNLLWVISFIYLINLLNNKELFIKIYLYTYIVIALLALFRVENIIDKHNKYISNNTVISNIGDIYDNNIKIMSDKDKIIDSDTLDLLKKVKENASEYKNNNGEIPFVARYFKKIWITQILDIIPVNRYTVKSGDGLGASFWGNNIKEVENDDSVSYFVWLPDMDNVKGVNIDNYIVLYKNNKGYILKKKSLK